MSRLKSFICIIFVLFLSGCYESEIVIEINNDGSGIMTSRMHFDNATSDQRHQIKAMLNQPDTKWNFNKKVLGQDSTNPYFEIIDLQEDKENLRFKSVVKFQDINRALASSSLKGLDFEVDGDSLVFKIVRTSQASGFGSGVKLAGKNDGLNLNIYPKESIRFTSAESNDFIEFVHEYKGDDVEKDVAWNDRLIIPGHQ